tara:strand:+ start:29487 stop:30134 length:648 start_codon:yes stop_codon:yes gene_type:complete
MEQKQYNLKTALSIACDIFDKQGYVKEIQPGKDVDTNKSVLSKRLDKEPNFVHSNIKDILNFKQELVFKKLSGKLSDYEHLVIKILEKEKMDLREMGIVASVPLMYSNAMKKRAKQEKYESFQQTSQFRGVLGQKYYAPVVLLDKMYHNRGFWIYTFVEDGKHILKWLTGKDYEEFTKGSKIKLSGVVKLHNTTGYYGDETTLRSCKLIRDIENA